MTMEPDESGALLAALKAAGATWPDQRLGQLIDNAVEDHDRGSLFYLSDEELVFALRQYARAKA